MNIDWRTVLRRKQGLAPQEQATYEIPFLDADALQQAYDGSWYTIIGAGGDLAEWVSGYEEWLAAEELGTPVQWYLTNGGAINAYARVSLASHQAFASDLTVLLFPLDGLAMDRLPLFKILHMDRWFDDVIDNMRATH